MPNNDRSNYHAYRKEVNAHRGLKRFLLVVLVLLLIAIAGLTGYLLGHAGVFAPAFAGQQTAEEAGASATAATALPASAPTPIPTPVSTPEPDAEPTPAPASGESAQTLSYLPDRLLAQVDNASWDTATKVEATLNQDYQNTDYRMVALPMLGTVTNDYFNTVTFVGDSLTSGLGIYNTGLPNAHYVAYLGAGPDVVVNNSTAENLVTHAQETPVEAIIASQPDYVYILFGTNTLVSPNNEDRLLAYYEKMIDDLRAKLNPGVIFYMQSIPGVQEDVVQTKPGLDNNRIINVNNMLANLALRKGCYFINIREALTKQDGSMIDEYDAQYDGVHFNPTGYRAWSQYLATHTAWNARSVYIGQNPYKILGS